MSVVQTEVSFARPSALGWRKRGGWVWAAAAMSATIVALASSPPAVACPGNERCGVCDHDQTPPSAAERDPSACAQRPELVGGACSYTTSVMAKRVLAEGKPWSFTGHLAPSTVLLDSHVAAPYTVGPAPVFVVANEVLEGLVGAGTAMQRLTLEGRLLDVGGTPYFVLENYVTYGS
jgi:hypothetical protein